MSFNIFTTLSKDNKELIHSAFLKFLLEEDPEFSNNLLKVPLKLKKEEVILEKRFTKKHRLDILIIKDDSDEVIAIENKFKCLPRKKQLEIYDEAIGKVHPTAKKFLLYFKKGVGFELPAGWGILTYAELLKEIQCFLNKKPELANDKKVFITHYMEFLKDYIDAYEIIMNNPAQMKSVFEGEFIYRDIIQNDNNYWLNLIFHELAVYFEDKNHEIYLESGSSYKPLINIMLDHWKREKYKFVIQLNGRNLKYYANLKGVEEKQKVVDDEINLLKSNGFVVDDSGKFKGKIKNGSNTCFIYMEDLTKALSKEKFTIKGIGQYIIGLISKIDKARNKGVVA